MKKLNEVFDTNYETLVKDIKTNTKEINEGDLFVCIKGFNADRHDFVDEAKRKGAKARNLNTFEKINLSKPLKNGYFFVKF